MDAPAHRLELRLNPVPDGIECLTVRVGGLAPVSFEIGREQEWRGHVALPGARDLVVQAQGFSSPCSAMNAASFPLWGTDAVTPATDGAGTARIDLKLIGACGRSCAQNDEVSTNRRPLLTAAPPPPLPPRVVRTSPVLGARGVEIWPLIQVTFSERMNFASAQASFQILAPSGIGGVFSWNDTGMTMTFRPNRNFSYSQEVKFEISQGALSFAGVPKTQSDQYFFTVLRLAATKLRSIASFDGHIDNKGRVYATSTSLRVGDTNDGHYYRSFLTFDLAQLPATLVKIMNARIFMYDRATHGKPFERLGPLYAREINYGASLDRSDFDLPYGYSPVFNTRFYPMEAPAFVDDHWAHRLENGYRSQFGIYFERDFSFEILPLSDFVEFYSADYRDESLRPMLEVQYLIP
jgi:hypothetical protein